MEIIGGNFSKGKRVLIKPALIVSHSDIVFLPRFANAKTKHP